MPYNGKKQMLMKRPADVKQGGINKLKPLSKKEALKKFIEKRKNRPGKDKPVNIQPKPKPSKPGSPVMMREYKKGNKADDRIRAAYNKAKFRNKVKDTIKKMGENA